MHMRRRLRSKRFQMPWNIAITPHSGEEVSIELLYSWAFGERDSLKSVVFATGSSSIECKLSSQFKLGSQLVRANAV